MRPASGQGGFSLLEVLVAFAILGVAATLLLVYLPAQFAFYALLLASFANSLMWPAIWPLAMKDLGKFTKAGASLLVMAIWFIRNKEIIVILENISQRLILLIIGILLRKYKVPEI